MKITLALKSIFTIFLLFLSIAIAGGQNVPSAPRNTIWVSSTASHDVIANRESISAFTDKARKAGIDTVILYTKELNGHVVYPSKIAPRLTEHCGVKYDTNFDPLKTFSAYSNLHT